MQIHQCRVAEEFFARLLSAVCGLNFTAEDLMRVGERTWNVERLYNLREGFTKADDTLPDRLLNSPVEEGPSAGLYRSSRADAQGILFFPCWDVHGVPSPAK